MQKQTENEMTGAEAVAALSPSTSGHGHYIADIARHEAFASGVLGSDVLGSDAFEKESHEAFPRDEEAARRLVEAVERLEYTGTSAVLLGGVIYASESAEDDLTKKIAEIREDFEPTAGNVRRVKIRVVPAWRWPQFYNAVCREDEGRGHDLRDVNGLYQQMRAGQRVLVFEEDAERPGIDEGEGQAGTVRLNDAQTLTVLIDMDEGEGEAVLYDHEIPKRVRLLAPLEEEAEAAA